MGKRKKKMIPFWWKYKQNKKKISTIITSVHEKGAVFSSEVELIREIILIKILKKRVL